MNFISLQYCAFLLVSVFLYFSLPHKVRRYLLLLCSYFFYMCWKPQYALLMLFCTVVTYGCALLIKHEVFGYRKVWLGMGVGISIFVLFVFKYFGFAVELLNNVLNSLGNYSALSLPDILLPVGISFFTFQALGYIIDVYRGSVSAEKNFADYALFISFFPPLVAGPIERTNALLPQLKDSSRKFSSRSFFEGTLMILWGIFKKLVVADRLSVMVNYAYSASDNAPSGLQYGFAAVFFYIQIYCDFSAYTDMARGSAKMFGIDLMQNFKTPYLASSIKDFWRRWHISLSTWFKDYLYFPLGGSRVPKYRTCLNLFVVFLVSGLWHGAALTFIAWGALHGLYQIASFLTASVRSKFLRIIKISDNNIILAVFRRIFTFALVSVTFIFFRAESLRQSLRVIKAILTDTFSHNFYTELTMMQVNAPDLHVLLVAVVIVFVVDFFMQDDSFCKRISQRLVLKYVAYFFLIICILLFGSYGPGFNARDFIYFQF